MVDDLKARLRNWSNGPDDEPPIRLMQAAADRIEKIEDALREALDMIVDCARDSNYSVSEFNDLRAIVSPPKESRSWMR